MRELNTVELSDVSGGVVPAVLAAAWAATASARLIISGASLGYSIGTTIYRVYSAEIQDMLE